VAVINDFEILSVIWLTAKCPSIFNWILC